MSCPYLGEEGSPDWLNIINTGGLDEGVQLVGLPRVSPIPMPSSKVSQEGKAYGDIDTVIGEDEGGVRGCKLSVRHFEGLREERD